MEKAESTALRRRGRAAGGVLARIGVVGAVVAAATGSVYGLTKAASPEASPTTNEIPALSVQAADVEFGSAAPVGANINGTKKAKPPKAKPTQRPTQEPKSKGTDLREPDAKPSEQPEQKSAEEQLTEWAEQSGQATGIPPRALLAYARAELTVREQSPACNISWATIAGIGRVESDHGRFQGSSIDEDGYPTKPIVGVPLDGSGGFASISDTDGGKYDGDKKVDRAVGPMQFIPSTWARHGADGNGDGEADPQQVDDAALAAAGYLCTGGRDMGTAKGWWEGLWSYNRSVEYGQKVFGLADEYAKRIAAQQ